MAKTTTDFHKIQILPSDTDIPTQLHSLEIGNAGQDPATRLLGYWVHSIDRQMLLFDPSKE
jgi:hypothetical protein